MSILVRASVEPPGVNCGAGGTKIEIGADDNPTNGTLDAAEVDSTHYICSTDEPAFGEFMSIQIVGSGVLQCGSVVNGPGNTTCNTPTLNTLPLVLDEATVDTICSVITGSTGGASSTGDGVGATPGDYAIWSVSSWAVVTNPAFRMTAINCPTP